MTKQDKIIQVVVIPHALTPSNFLGLSLSGKLYQAINDHNGVPEKWICVLGSPSSIRVE